MTFQYFLTHFSDAQKNGNGYKARCPAHDDKQASLSIAQSRDGKILLKCFAGCTAEQIVAVRNLTLADLFEQSRQATPKLSFAQRVETTYDYCDESGQLLFQAVRLHSPKDFRQRRPEGKHCWAWNLQGVRRVLYRLPELLAADSAATAFIVEGEKDVERLRSLGLVATTNPQGAGKWRTEFSECLREREVVILPDNDEPGRKHVEAVAKSLHGVAALIKVLPLPNLPEKGDVSDWLDAGGTAEELGRLAEGAAEWRPQAAPKTQPQEVKKAQPTKARVGDVEFRVVEDGLAPGVYAIEADGDRTFICSPLFIEAAIRNEHSESWGRLLRFPDPDGVWHQWAMPSSMLSADGREYRERLLELGLVIAPSRKARTLLEAYLNTKPDKKALCATKQGWHRGVFVLPDETIGEHSEPIYLQTLNANHLFRQAGAVEDWREQLGRYCAGNSRLLLAASIAFAAPLLEPLQGENGGWHFTGGSSVGKTTALYVAGSIHGGGGDKGFIRRWRATINGLESVAESHHDALLCLDEIAECRPDDVNEAAYMLANGQGKTRQARGGSLRRTAEWRVTFLSSGEISLADHVAQTGKRVRAGQEVRVINLPADAEKGHGLFEDLHDFSNGDEFARYLQRTARDYYGAPLRAFLCGVAGSQHDLIRRYRVFETALLEEMLPPGAASEVSRVAHRFALAAFAGELATELELTGWQPEEATAATKTLFATWLAARGTTGSTDEEAALRQVRRFFESHGQSRFQQLGLAGEKIINRAGYFEQADDEGLIYYVLPEVFRAEVCGGFDHRAVAKALNQKGCLRTTHDLRCQKRLPEGNKKAYAILSKLLED